jgi:hypothetical protein
MADYPRSMKYLLSRIVGVTRQTIRMNASTTSTVTGGSSLQWGLPQNTYLDATSVHLWINAAAPANCVFPRNIENLVENNAISIGNAAVEQPCQRFNILQNNIHNLLNCNKTAQRSVLQNANIQPLLTYTTNLTTGSPAIGQVTTGITAAVKEVATVAPYNIGGTSSTVGTTRQWFAIPFQFGLLGTTSTKIIPTQVLGDVVINTRFAGNEVLINGEGISATASPSAASAWNFQEAYMSCTAYSFGDGLYDEIVSRQVASGLLINFHQWQSQQGPTNVRPMTTMTNVSSQSVNKLVGLLINTGKSAPDRNVMNPTTYQSDYFTCTGAGLGDKGLTQWHVNTALYPLEPACPHEVYLEDLKALALNNDMYLEMHPECNSLSKFQNNFFMSVLPLALDNEDSGSISGLDTRGANGQIQLAFTPSGTIADSGNNFSQLIFAETTKTLVVRPFKQVIVIQ